MTSIRILSILALVSASCSSQDGPLSEDGQNAVERSGVLALEPVEGSDPAVERVRQAQQQVQAKSDDPARWVVLAETFVVLARHRQEPRAYDRADDAAARALQLRPGYPGALALQGTVLSQSHRFREAAALARQALERAPHDLRALGLYADCLVELGSYDEAEVTIQAMIDQRPDSRSYARAAWLRWLTGDPEGAIEAFGLAEDAARGGDPEAHAWILVQLGTALRESGDGTRAEQAYAAALQLAPGYAAAQTARGRMLVDRGRADEALADLEAAVQTTELPEMRWALVDALRATGQRQRADAQAATLLGAGAAIDPRTTALYLASRGGDAERAVALARAELERRDDVLSADVLSWSLFAAGDLEGAARQSARALRLGTRDARMLFHAGMIAAARGERAQAENRLRAALAANAQFDVVDAPRAREELDRLEAVDRAETVASR